MNDDENRKEWEVPYDLKAVWDKVDGLIELRDIFVRIPFGYKKAVKTSIAIVRTKEVFWDGVRELYDLPEAITYDKKKGVIFETKKQTGE